MRYKCLSIAGFDGSGGAGIQADLKTFCALGCYGMNVLTAIPVQNTGGVRRCYALPSRCIWEQLEAIFDDIKPDAIKVGMLFSIDIIEQVACFLKRKATGIPLVLDPVMVAKSGDLLLQSDAVDVLKQTLIPLATIMTPNLPEAQTLVGEMDGQASMTQALLRLGCDSVLLKGGHDQGATSDDFFLDSQGNSMLFSMERIASKNTHGTGCTLSAAICAYLAKGDESVVACGLAKSYLHGAILASKNNSVGKGAGPVNHLYQGVLCNCQD